MPGTLHIFRLKADPLQYQVNYNLGAKSYARVFDPSGLDGFLRHNSSLPISEVEALLEELRSSGHTTEAHVHLSEAHLAEMGFTELPGDR
jgi:hypothetical protein